MIELNKIYNMDCLEGLKLIDDNSIDLIITDPPFNQNKIYANHNDNLNENEYFDWCNKWIKEGFRVLKNDGSFYVQINSKNMFLLYNIMNKYGIYQNACIWIKHSSPMTQKRRYSKNYQVWLFFTKTEKYNFYYNAEKIIHRYEPYKYIANRNIEGRNVDDIWEDICELSTGYLAQKEVLLDGNGCKLHVQQMPIALPKRMILHSSNVNDIILDMFIGSGTTAIACLETNRNFIGFENDLNHFNLSNNRLSTYKNQVRF